MYRRTYEHEVARELHPRPGLGMCCFLVENAKLVYSRAGVQESFHVHRCLALKLVFSLGNEKSR